MGTDGIAWLLEEEEVVSLLMVVNIEESGACEAEEEVVGAAEVLSCDAG